MDEKAEKFVVDYPLEIYRPFTEAETAILRDFVANARLLRGMRLFQQTPKRASVNWDVDTGFKNEMDEPEDEAVRAALTVFRQLYKPSEAHSFNRVINLLKRSVDQHGGPRRQEALDFFAYYPAEQKRRMGAVGIGIVFEGPDGQRPIDTEMTIEAYMHGHYLHGTNEKSELAKQLDEMQPFPRFTLYTTMHYLAGLYWMAANVIDRILDAPQLLDAEDHTGGAA